MTDDNGRDSWFRSRLIQDHRSETDYREAAHKVSSRNGLLQSWTEPRYAGSGPEVRFINPAIYTESVHDDDDESEARVWLNVEDKKLNEDRGDVIGSNTGSSYGDSSIDVQPLSTLSIKNDLAPFAGDYGERMAQDTYRCTSSNSMVTTALSQSEASTVRSNLVVSPRQTTLRVERRCRIGVKPNGTCLTVPLPDGGSSVRQSEQPEVQRYTVNGHRVVQMSASLSSSNMSENQIASLDAVTLARRMAHDEWMRRKREHAQRKKVNDDREDARRRTEEDRLRREKEEKERRERESFLRWSEKKKKEEADRKATLEKELELQQRLKEVEEQAALAKALCHRQWVRKKDEEQKAHQKKEQLKQKVTEEEFKKRSEESSKAYEKWWETAKNRPKPATQGLLPHQKAKPAYINPTPWQGIIEEDSEKAENEVFNSRMLKTGQPKRNGKK